VASSPPAPRSINEIHPILFQDGAARFLRAADEMYAFEHSKEWIGTVQEPVYVLYAHAIELALKAFLRMKNVSTSELAKKPLAHDLLALYQRAVQLKLDPLPDVAKHFEVVLPLMKGSIDIHAYRYWTAETTDAPKANWLRSVAHEMNSTVASRLVGFVAVSEPGAPPEPFGHRGTRLFGPEHFGLRALPEQENIGRIEALKRGQTPWVK